MSLKTLAKTNNFPTVFNDFFEPWNEWFTDGLAGKAMTLPKVNITENDKNFNVELAAPGLHKNDFKIDVDGNLLTISAKKEDNKEEKNEKYTRQEYNYSSFSRSFTLPDGVLQDKIEATYDGGILKLALPKNEKATQKNHKAITIN